MVYRVLEHLIVQVRLLSAQANDAILGPKYHD